MTALALQTMAPDAIRSAFSSAMSAMYRAEVPQYGTLIEIVGAVNDAVLAGDAPLAQQMRASGELARLDSERHGAIRVGTAEELSALARVFAVMGMAPVDYYDLAPTGLPVHSTAFRATDAQALASSPFRVFCSLLRLDLIADADLRTQAETVLASRNIVSDRCMELVAKAERDGGLDEGDAARFVREAADIFRWHADALVDLPTYERLLAAHRLIADVVSFKGPHINHLTPRTLDIDAAQQAMLNRGLKAKAVIEGPPRRNVPILLRQTSFHALDEAFRPVNGGEASHTARFGEIEQRGAALTEKGRTLYDECLAASRAAPGANGDHEARLAQAFASFPDDFAAMREQRLAFARYRCVAPGTGACELDEALERGVIVAEPQTYEDFLPVSAAGIFRSNLGEERQAAERGNAPVKDGRALFEAALGRAIVDPFALYRAEEERSRMVALAELI